MNRPDCHICEGTGWLEEGEQVDVDHFVGCDCNNCNGSGVEPYHLAGGRFTGPARQFHFGVGFGDTLEVMGKMRDTMRGPLPKGREWVRASLVANYMRLRTAAMKRSPLPVDRAPLPELHPVFAGMFQRMGLAA